MEHTGEELKNTSTRQCPQCGIEMKRWYCFETDLEPDFIQDILDGTTSNKEVPNLGWYLDMRELLYEEDGGWVCTHCKQLFKVEESKKQPPYLITTATDAIKEKCR